MIYFSGKAQQYFDYPDLYGLMCSYKTTGGERRALDSGCRWMMDNGAFSGNFDEARWIKRMELYQKYTKTCYGIIAPDAVILDKRGDFVCGDWRETLNRLAYYAPIIRTLGFPVAYAVQDNHPLDAMPWNLLDVIFVAGNDDWKTSYQMEQIAIEAKRRGIWVHVGRVSSQKRIRATWWADSWDGTTFKWEPAKKYRRLNPLLSGEVVMAKQYKLLEVDT